MPAHAPKQHPPWGCRSRCRSQPRSRAAGNTPIVLDAQASTRRGPGAVERRKQQMCGCCANGLLPDAALVRARWAGGQMCPSQGREKVLPSSLQPRAATIMIQSCHRHVTTSWDSPGRRRRPSRSSGLGKCACRSWTVQHRQYEQSVTPKPWPMAAPAAQLGAGRLVVTLKVGRQPRMRRPRMDPAS